MKILLYHRITCETPDDIHSVSADLFASHMQWLDSQKYAVVRFQDWLKDRPRDGGRRREIILTFDDGYLDNYTNAFPILKQYGFPATIFLISSKVNKVTRGLNNLPANIPMLGWDQIHEMNRGGIGFGAHSVSHPYLTQLENSRIEYELRQSRFEIEENLGQSVNLFSYPHSNINWELKNQVRSAGYQAACTYQPYYVGRPGSDTFELQRVGILSTDTLEAFSQKIQGSLNRVFVWYKRSLFRWLKKATRIPQQGMLGVMLFLPVMLALETCT